MKFGRNLWIKGPLTRLVMVPFHGSGALLKDIQPEFINSCQQKKVVYLSKRNWQPKMVLYDLCLGYLQRTDGVRGGVRKP